MYRVEMYARVRRACRVEGMSTREASRVFGLDRKTVRKMLSFSAPPGYRRGKPPRRPKLGPFTGIIDRILEDDRTSHHKQRHTAKRIFDRLRDEYGFTGGYTIVKDYVRERRLRSREMFVPLVHSPGHAQADFGEAMAVIGGVARKVHFLAFDLPHSDACFVKAYPAETTEAFCDGHNAAVAFFGGVPRSILYDNTKLAVARILGDGKRQRTRVFTELQSHYLFEDRFGRPGKGNDKGKVEGLVGFIRRNFLVPVPRAESFEALNDALAGQCRRRQAARLRGHKETIGERLARDREAFLPLPPAPYDACDKRPGRVSSLSLVRCRGNDYSAPVAYATSASRSTAMRPSTPRGRDTRRATSRSSMRAPISATPNGHPLSPPSFGSTAAASNATPRPASGTWPAKPPTTCRTPCSPPTPPAAPSGHTGGLKTGTTIRVMSPWARTPVASAKTPAFSLASAVSPPTSCAPTTSPT